MSLLKTPKTQLGFLLALIFITAFSNNPSLKVILIFALSVGSTLLSDLLFLKFRGIKPFFPSAALVTGSIIGLLTSPHVNWYIPFMISAAAMFSKNFLRFENRHIFNPAAFGLLVGSLILATPVSWWAVSFQQFSIPFLILLSPALISLVRMKRYRITLSFLIVYVLLAQFLNLKSSILNLIADPTTLFFSIVMLTEPMTSPNNYKRQVVFGAFVSLTALILGALLIPVDPFLTSLLIANAVFFKFR